MDLAGEVLKGGASGIGLAAAKAYVAKGAKVVIADFNEEGGKQAAEDLKNDGEILFVKTSAIARNRKIEKHLLMIRGIPCLVSAGGVFLYGLKRTTRFI
ncbi:SDR family NAD(P)-dependent oxidoreductase [Planococcus sp. ISL-109]|uniref:SDR family NAD(P)-dependent oxidoreductase n=1 Tax=Planococcus sp. ISL-109 TaxID=2819166 RepID=UPI001BE5B26A|nr:SDR family NAD(P)-dependent oxidoreductase [Planococcus sp. ISL-109]MBT2583479.1 SDR family NAD(P)-dependent oxidoreductase [Planococcus sp. ISL-109]